MTALSSIRRFWAAICLLAAIALLAACGTDAPPPAATSETTAPVEEPASPAATALATTAPASPEAPTTAPTPAVAPDPTSVPIPTAAPSTAAPSTAAPSTASPEPTVPSTAAPTSPPATEQPTVAPESPPPAWTGALTYEVVATHPHDTSSFTQGLLWFDGQLYESTGLRGQSVLRIIDLPTGRVLQEIAADPRHFGEGLALVDDQLIWLTWQAGTATVHHRDSLEQFGSFTYAGEGWGLCHDGTRLVMSDGSNTLTFRHPTTFEATGSVAVTRADGSPVNRLNELECVGDQVWANVWLTDRIVVINPATGAVVAEADMAGIISPHPVLSDSNDVLNGIAYRPDTGTFLITGKRWPSIFEVRFE